MRLLPLPIILLLLALPVTAAINPAEFQRVASEQLQIREISRLVHEAEQDGDRLRRTTLVGQVVKVQRGPNQLQGRTVVIDYTVNLTARERAAAKFRAEHGHMPGPQFMDEPDLPVPDADGLYWAHLAPLGGRLGNVNRHAGAVVGIGDYESSGDVFVPVAGQYSFLPPM